MGRYTELHWLFKLMYQKNVWVALITEKNSNLYTDKPHLLFHFIFKTKDEKKVIKVQYVYELPKRLIYHKQLTSFSDSDELFMTICDIPDLDLIQLEHIFSECDNKFILQPFTENIKLDYKYQYISFNNTGNIQD